MNAIFAAAGPAAARLEGLGTRRPFDRMRRVVDRDGAVLGCAGDDGAALLQGSDGAGGIVALGSAVSRSRLEAHTILDRLKPDGRPPGDLVALGCRTGEAAFAYAGQGPHRLFRASPPEGGLLVSSSLELLGALLGPDRDIDRSYEDFLLGFGFLPDGRTVLAGVTTQSAGSLQLIDRGSIPDPVSQAAAERPIVNSRAEAVEELYGRFMGAVEEQAGSDRHHAVLLGGLDSALIVAALRRLGHSVDTYTFSFSDPRYNQRNTDVVESALGATHHWVAITPKVIEQGMREFGVVMHQPSAQPHYQLHTIHACRAIAKDGHHHVFTGDGCDAVFLGYPTVSRRAALVRRAALIPAPIAAAAHRVLEIPAMERRLGHVARVARSSLTNLVLPELVRGHLPTRYLDEVALRRLRSDPGPPQAEPVNATRQRLAAPHEHLDHVRLAFHGNGLTGQSKAKVEAAVAASGVAQSSPYMHPAVAQYVAALPVDFLRTESAPSGGAGKELLVEMVRARDLLPETLISQPKQSPSDSPIDAWYMGPLRPTVMEILGDLPFDWNRRYVEELLEPKLAERWFRERVSISHHALQAIGLLWSYAAFTGAARVG